MPDTGWEAMSLGGRDRQQLSETSSVGSQRVPTGQFAKTACPPEEGPLSPCNVPWTGHF